MDVVCETGGIVVTYMLAANQDANNIVVFKINQNTGKLNETGSTVSLSKPVCITFLNIIL